MKKLLFLHKDDLETPKKVSKAEEAVLQTQLCRKSIKQFKKDMKEWIDNKSIKITKEYDEATFDMARVIIEFDEDRNQEVYDKLITVDIVETIDSFLPTGET